MTTTPNNTTAMLLPTATDIVATVKACLWPDGGHITDNDARNAAMTSTATYLELQAAVKAMQNGE